MWELIREKDPSDAFIKDYSYSIVYQKCSISKILIVTHVSAVPVNFLTKRDGTQRIFQEKKSFEHDYNSRKDTNYPVRGKVSVLIW